MDSKNSHICMYHTHAHIYHTHATLLQASTMTRVPQPICALFIPCMKCRSIKEGILLLSIFILQTYMHIYILDRSSVEIKRKKVPAYHLQIKLISNKKAFGFSGIDNLRFATHNKIPDALSR